MPGRIQIEAMRKPLILAFVIGLSISGTSANASIFGQSKCEKVTASINQQDSVGRGLWEILNNAVKKRKASGSTTDNLAIVLATEDLWNQYVVLADIVINNPQCFKTSQVSTVISIRTGAKNLVARYKTWENTKSWSGFRINNPGKTYLSFKDLLTVK